MKKIFFCCLLIPVFFSGCSSSRQVQSNFNENIIVDGRYDDWGTSLSHIEDENFAAGFVNNKDYLYITLVTSDRNNIRKILMNGLTVWIESSSGKIGIRYPLRIDPSEVIPMRNRETSPQEEFKADDILKGREDLQVVNQDEFPLFTSRAAAGESFRAKINNEQGQLIYELRIPLINNEFSGRVFADGINETEVTFNTGEMQRENMQRPGGMPSDGMRRGGGKRGMGGMNRSGMQPDFSPFEYTFIVTLDKK